MSNLEMIEMLCALVEQQSSLIGYLVLELEHVRNLTETEQQMVDATRQEYSAILGADEAPDFLTEL